MRFILMFNVDSIALFNFNESSESLEINSLFTISSCAVYLCNAILFQGAKIQTTDCI